MKYYVTFQEFGPRGRPIDHPSTADYETEALGMLPNVGDYVQIEPLGNEQAPTYSGKVKSRLFRYLGKGNCGINIVIENTNDDIWGELIKE